MAVLPVFHLLSLAALDALSRMPFLKVRMLSAAVGVVDVRVGRYPSSVFADRLFFYVQFR